MFKVEDYNNKKIAIQTKTQEEYYKLMEMLKKSGIDTMNLKIWRHHKNETCITTRNEILNWCDKNWYLKEGYKIVEFEDIINPKQFTKSDLRDNDIVINRNGVKNLWKERQQYNWNEDLTHMALNECDIIKVERPTNLVTVFEREEKMSKTEAIKQAQILLENHGDLFKEDRKAIQELINYMKVEIKEGN